MRVLMFDCDRGFLQAHRPAWCSDSWCYVDKNNCDKVLGKSYLFNSADVYYSYSTCGAHSSFSTCASPCVLLLCAGGVCAQ